MVVAGAMLVLVVLVLPLLAPGAAACLRCWPDVPPHVHYDVRLLLGAAQPGGAAGLERELSALILGGDPGVRIMERERLEREAGKLFYRLDQIITRNQHDPGRLMKEAALEKQNFTRRLRAASAAVRQQVCSASCGRPEPFDLSECDSCERLQARCRDQRVCAGAAVILAVGLSLLGLVLGAAVGRRARPAGGTGAKEGPAAARTEPPAEQGDGAPADLGNGAPAEQGDGAPADRGNGAPPDLGNGAPAEQEDGAPADLGNGAPAEQGDGAPADLGNGAPAEQEDGAPADLGNGAPAEQGDGAPADLGNGAPAEQGDGAPADLGNGAPAEQEDGAPADRGNGAPPDLGNGAPAEQGAGAATH